MYDTTGVDFGRRSDDYLRHRPGLPGSFYDRLATFVELDGATALDLGTGPGLVACELASRGATVTGVDIAANQVETASRNAADRGLAEAATFRVASADDTGLADASCDLVTAGQCWGWFDHDATLREVTRVLRPGGVLCVAHFCYLSGRSDVAARTEHLILQRNPGWPLAGCTGIYDHYIDALQTGTMKLVEQFCYDLDQPFTHEGWRGRMRTCNGVGSGAMSDDGVAEFDTALAEMLRREFPDEPMAIAHRVWAVVVRRAGGPAA